MASLIPDRPKTLSKNTSFLALAAGVGHEFLQQAAKNLSESESVNDVFPVPVLRGSYLLSTHWSLISYIWLMLSYGRERSHLYVFHVMSYLLIVTLLYIV